MSIPDHPGTPVISLVDVLDDLDRPDSGPIALDPLVAAVRDADVDAGFVTDDELLLVAPQHEEHDLNPIDFPALAGLTDDQRDAALAATVRLLTARGELVDIGGGEDAAVGVLAVIGELRWGSDAVAVVTVDVRGEGTEHARIHRVRPDLFLCETIDADGLHEFVFRDHARQAAWLATAVDLPGHARRTAPAQVAATVDDLTPAPERLLADAHAATRVVLEERDPPPDRSAQRALTAYSTPDGVYVLHGWTRADAGEVTLQQVGPDDLVALCGAFLAPAGSGGQRGAGYARSAEKGPS